MRRCCRRKFPQRYLWVATPDPYDLTDIDLSEYKGIVAPWNTWRAVEEQCAALAATLMMPPT